MQAQKPFFKISLSLLVLAGFGSFTAKDFWPASSFKHVEKEPYVPPYFHKEKDALAVNPVKYPKQTAASYRIYEGNSGVFTIQLHTLTETDGECFYEIYQNNKRIGSFQNPSTTVDYAAHSFTLENIKVETGDSLTVTYQNHSNGKIPEGSGYAYARARWTGLTFTED